MLTNISIIFKTSEISDFLSILFLMTVIVKNEENMFKKRIITVGGLEF